MSENLRNFIVLTGVFTAPILLIGLAVFVANSCNVAMNEISARQLEQDKIDDQATAALIERCNLDPSKFECLVYLERLK